MYWRPNIIAFIKNTLTWSFESHWMQKKELQLAGCIINPAWWPRSCLSNAGTSIHILEPYLYHLQRPYMVQDRLEQSESSFSCTILITKAYVCLNFSGLVASNNFYLIRPGDPDLALNNILTSIHHLEHWWQWWPRSCFKQYTDIHTSFRTPVTLLTQILF